MTDAVVLAGGLGTRLRTVLADRPKPMAPVGGRPFLSWLLTDLARQGLRDVTLSVGYRAEDIRRHFGGRHGSLCLRYVEESSPLGTGGAIRAALDETTAGPVFVVNGDTFVEVDYRRMRARHEATGVLISIALQHVEACDRYGSVEVHGDRVVGFREKEAGGPGWINAGVYLLDPEVFGADAPAPPFSFERDFLTPRADRLRPLAQFCRGFFVDIGVPAEYERAQRELPRHLEGRGP